MKKKLSLLLFLLILTLITIPTAYANRTLKKCKYEFFSEMYGNSTAVVTFWESPDWDNALDFDYFNGKKTDSFWDTDEDIVNGSQALQNQFYNDGEHFICPYYLMLHMCDSIWNACDNTSDWGALYYDKNELVKKYPHAATGSNSYHILTSTSIETDWPGYDRKAQGDDYSIQGTELKTGSGNRTFHCLYNASDLGWTSGVLDVYEDGSVIVYAPIFGGEAYNQTVDAVFSKIDNWDAAYKKMQETGTCPYFLGMDEASRNQVLPTYSRADIMRHEDYDTGDTDAFILVSKTIEEDMKKNGDVYNPISDGKYKKYDDVKHKNFNSGMSVPTNIDWDPNDPYQFHVGDEFCGEERTVKLLKAFGNILLLAKFIIPILIVIMGMVDLLKVVVSGKEDDLKKKGKNLGYRVVIGLFVFFVPSLMNAFFSGLSYYAVISDDINQCQACLLNPNDDNYCEYWVEGTSFNPTISISAPVGPAPISSKTSGTDDTENRPTRIEPGSLTGAEASTRKKVADFAINAYNTQNSKFIYLGPSSTERDAETLTSIPVKNDSPSKMTVTGGNCLKKTYNGQTCIKYKGKEYFGTDCNGFVGYVYHMSIGIQSSTGRFFTPLYSQKDWAANSDKYFVHNKPVKTVAEALKIAQPGDAIGRICDKVDDSYHNHVGLYVGNGKMVENSGGRGTVEGRLTPLVYRSIEEFAKIGSYGSSSYKNCVLVVFTLKKF